MTEATSGEFLPANRDSTGGKGNPPPPKIDLRDAEAMRREMATLYRDMRAGRIDSQTGTRLAYVLNMIRQAYETDVLQKRLERLEELHGKHPNTP